MGRVGWRRRGLDLGAGPRVGADMSVSDVAGFNSGDAAGGGAGRALSRLSATCVDTDLLCDLGGLRALEEFDARWSIETDLPCDLGARRPFSIEFARW